jgi:hypothetical protein
LFAECDLYIVDAGVDDIYHHHTSTERTWKRTTQHSMGYGIKSGHHDMAIDSTRTCLNHKVWIARIWDIAKPAPTTAPTMIVVLILPRTSDNVEDLARRIQGDTPIGLL